MKLLHFLVTAILILFASNSAQAELSKIEKNLVKYIDQHNEEAIDLLEKLVNINSGTMNFQGIKKVGNILGKEFRNLNMKTSWEDGASFNRAGHLIAKTSGSKGKSLLLIGHLDTVFPKESPFQKYQKLDNDTASGPGVADMKGGNVIILQALSALHNANLLKDMNITVIMTGDEEFSGLPLNLSKKAIISTAKKVDIALGFENGDNNPKTANIARRGIASWTLKVKGRAGHSSRIFSDKIGYGAIFEASRILQKFQNDLAGEKYLTFNPGLIMGGSKLTYSQENSGGTAYGKKNVVANEVIITGDIRTLSEKQLKKVQKKMHNIVSNNLKHTSAILTFEDGYPPFEPIQGNYILLKQYSKASQDLGFSKIGPVDPAKAGAADISFAAPHVKMALDGLGLPGANEHSIKETGEIGALSMQTKKAALLIYRLGYAN